MPFKSKAQQRFLFSKKPQIAKEFAKATTSKKHLPEKVKPKRQLQRIPNDIKDKYFKKPRSLEETIASKIIKPNVRTA
jgi:ubiquinone/menaquinone biosynthesis C-methylase UbiE